MAAIRERTSKDGVRRFEVRVRLRGHPPQSATFRTRTDAKKWATQTESAIREGRYFKTTEAHKHTVAEMIDKYVEDELPTKSPTTIDAQQYHYKWWKDQIGPYALSEITPALIGKYRDKLAKTPTYAGKVRSGSSVNAHLSALSHAFTVARKEWGWIESNPCTNVRRPKLDNSRVRFLEDDERAALLRECKASQCGALYPIVTLAIATGMRRGEILGLTWKDIDFDKKVLILHKTKNGEKRIVPLGAHVIGVLRDWAKVRRIDTDRVFPRPPGEDVDKPLDFRNAFVAAVERAKIEDFRFHDTRHCTASYLLMSGVSMGEIAAVLGHKTLSMTKRYTHASESHVAGVIERMNEAVFGGNGEGGVGHGR